MIQTKGGLGKQNHLKKIKVFNEDKPLTVYKEGHLVIDKSLPQRVLGFAVGYNQGRGVIILIIIISFNLYFS